MNPQLNGATLDPQQSSVLAQLNSQPQQSASSQPNFLEKLLPTGMSVLGGVVGTALDPVTAGLGTVGGSALGSALGQQLENSMTGSTGSTLGAGAEGAIGGILGGLGGKALGAGAEKLGQLGANIDSKAAEAAYVAPFKGIENSVVAKSNDLNGTASLMKSLDVPGTPQAWSDAASVGTGRQGLGAMTKAMDTITTDAGQLPSNNLTGRVASALQEGGVDPNSPDLKWLGKSLDNATSQGTTDAEGNAIKGPVLNDNAAGATINEQVDAPSLLKTVQKLGDQIAPYHNPNVQLTVGDASKLQGLQNAKAELEDTLYGNGIDKAVSGYSVSPEDSKNILDAAGGNQKLATYVEDGINNASTGKELRAAQAPLVQASKLANAAKFQANGQLPGTLEDQMAKAVDGATGDVIPKGAQDVASAIHPGAGLVAKVANKLGTQGLQGAAKLANGIPKGLIPVLAQLGAHAPSLGADAGASGGTLGSMGAMNPYQTQGAGTPQGPSMAWAGEFAPSMVPAMQQAQKAQAGQPILNSLEQSYANAGGAQGAGGGLLSQLSSLIPGTAAHQYNAQMQQTAAALAQATGMPIQSILAALPSLMAANQQGAQNAFGGIQGALGTMQGAPQFAQPSVLGAMPAQ